MSDLRTAAQQALDSINELFAAEQSEGGERGGHIRTPATREHLVRVAKARRALHENFVALRAALAEPIEPVAWRWGYRSVTTGEMDWRGYVETPLHPNLRSPEIIMEPLYTAPPQLASQDSGSTREGMGREARAAIAKVEGKQ